MNSQLLNNPEYRQYRNQPLNNPLAYDVEALYGNQNQANQMQGFGTGQRQAGGAFIHAGAYGPPNQSQGCKL